MKKTIKRTAKKTTKKKAKKALSTLVVFLLDRSGSMVGCQEETMSGFNAYIKGLKGDIKFTLTQFDSIGIDIVHDAVPIKSVVPLNNGNYRPRGNTPLFDAIGKTIRATEKSANKSNILFVTLTDGAENASSKWSRDGIRSLIKQKEDEGWTFAHIGVGLDGFNAVQSYSVGTRSASNVMANADSDDGKARMLKMAKATSVYHKMSQSARGMHVNTVSCIWDK